MYQANKRQGNASTKVMSDVSGGGKKPWRQKGTGRARTSSIRNPIWRGGGTIFGPHPKSFKRQIPKTIKRLALLHSLNSKLSNGLFGVIKDLSIEEPKTKKLKKVMETTGISGTVLIAVNGKDKNLYLASRNLSAVNLVQDSNINALDVVKYNNFLITEKAIENLTKRLRP